MAHFVDIRWGVLPGKGTDLSRGIISDIDHLGTVHHLLRHFIRPLGGLVIVDEVLEIKMQSNLTIFRSLRVEIKQVELNRSDERIRRGALNKAFVPVGSISTKLKHSIGVAPEWFAVIGPE